ncbi:nucleotidyltransferase domain-containing protein [Bermanella sp. R86510]|uniref:nucleotidyltransferase domain-containing protein n=1 Tax=unclassified Bermanella TaxID=2627862 RepID=UPI0037C631B2
MRITQEYKDTIKSCAQTVFGENAVVKLFGSRLDDSKLGGDIDLLIESNTKIDNARMKSLKYVAQLQMKLGDQRFDVIVVDPDTELKNIHFEAQRTGVEL